MSEKLKCYDVTADELGEKIELLSSEVRTLEEINKSTSRTNDSLAAQAHGAKLLQLLYPLRDETELYAYYLGRINGSARSAKDGK